MKSWNGITAYEGEMQNGMPHGWGTMACDKNGITYEGEIFSGYKHGHGTMRYSNGDVYVGQFVMDEEEGVGTLTSTDGYRSEGEWKLGVQHGHSTLSKCGKVLYEGQYAKGVEHGRGKIFLSSGVVFEGELKNGYPQKQGTLSYPNGKSVYEGEVAITTHYGYLTMDIAPHGHGKVTYESHVFEGEFKDGLQHGLATETFPDGVVTRMKMCRGNVAGCGVVVYSPSTDTSAFVLHKGRKPCVTWRGPIIPSCADAPLEVTCVSEKMWAVAGDEVVQALLPQQVLRVLQELRTTFKQAWEREHMDTVDLLRREAEESIRRCKEESEAACEAKKCHRLRKEEEDRAAQRAAFLSRKAKEEEEEASRQKKEEEATRLQWIHTRCKAEKAKAEKRALKEMKKARKKSASVFQVEEERQRRSKEEEEANRRFAEQLAERLKV